MNYELCAMFDPLSLNLEKNNFVGKCGRGC